MAHELSGRSRTSGGFDLETLPYDGQINDVVIGDINADGFADLVYVTHPGPNTYDNVGTTESADGGSFGHTVTTRRVRITRGAGTVVFPKPRANHLVTITPNGS